MIRSLKAFGLALIAMCAISAMTASAAQALPELTASEHGTIEGSQIGSHELKVGSRWVICEETKFTGDNVATSQTSLTVTAEYQKCKTTPIFGISLFVTLTMNGCDYVFHSVGIDGSTYTATMDIVCPAGKQIEAHFYSNSTHTNEHCTITIGPQTGLTTNEITNLAGSPNDMLIHHDIGLNVMIHGSKIVCGEGATATYQGTTTLEARNTGGAQVGLTASDPSEPLSELTAAEHGTAKGSQVGSHELKVGNRLVICEETEFTGDGVATSQTLLTVTAKYQECRTTPALGVVLQVTVTMNGCDYMFSAAGIDGSTYTATVDIVCPAGKQIELHMYKNAGHTEEACTITIGPQMSKATNEITNVAGSTNDLLIHHDVDLNVTIHGVKVLCGEGATATYQGTTTLQAHNTAGAQVGLTVSDSSKPKPAPELTAAEHGTIVGSPVGFHELTFGSRSVLCEGTSFAGTGVVTSQTTLTVQPEYRECRPTGGAEPQHITVTMNGCDYLFHLTAVHGATYTATMDIVCPADKQIEIHSYADSAHTQQVCTMTIAPQTGKTMNEITNLAGPPDELLIHHDMALDVTTHGNGVVCQATAVTYEGTTTLKAFNTVSEQVGLTASAG
jgi:hypothetical protein